MLKGDLVGLAAIEKEDLRALLDWRNNADFRKNFREYRELSMEMQERWFEKSVLNDPSTLMFSIRKMIDRELIGCCGLCYINWVHRHADLSIYIGLNNFYIDDIGYAEDSCKILLNYGFMELGLNKIWTEIYEFDEKKLSLYRRLGFSEDGNLRDNHYYDGKWWDSKILSLLKSEYK